MIRAAENLARFGYTEQRKTGAERAWVAAIDAPLLADFWSWPRIASLSNRLRSTNRALGAANQVREIWATNNRVKWLDHSLAPSSDSLYTTDGLNGKYDLGALVRDVGPMPGQNQAEDDRGTP